MKTLLAILVGTGSLLATHLALAQNGYMMNGGGMWSGGWMCGDGGAWMPVLPILLLIGVVGLVVWLVKRK